jgi:hypothetical protein
VKRANLLLSAISTMAACFSLIWSQASPPPPRPSAEFLTLMEKGLYLEGLEALERERSRPGFDRTSYDQAVSFVKGASVGHRSPRERPCAATAAAEVNGDVQAADALKEIVRHARSAQIVILNEDHLEPRHRAFGLQVARALRPLGYRHLALEAFLSGDDDQVVADHMRQVAARGYPVHTDGMYTNDPMFADFLTQAMALGYQPHAYDGGPRTAGDRVAAREQFQAQNIARRILAADPRAKILVYVGFRHATEVPFDGGLGRQMEWMARRLKRITGIDPLTVDQREHVPAECLSEGLLRRGTLASRFGDVVLKQSRRPFAFGSYRGAVDLHVLHLPVAPISGRPAWMTQVGRRPLRVPAALLGGNSRKLIQAFAPGASQDAVPIDQILVEPGERRLPPLMVRDRRSTLRVQETPAPL